MRLCELKVGQCGVVVALNTEGDMRRRLSDIGLVNGTIVKCVGRSPGKDPAAYLIRGAVIAIRDGDCADILIERRDLL